MIMQDYHDAAFQEEQVPYFSTTIPPSIRALIEMQEDTFVTHGSVSHLDPHAPIAAQYKAAAACYWTASYCLKSNEIKRVQYFLMLVNAFATKKDVLALHCPYSE